MEPKIILKVVAASMFGIAGIVWMGKMNNKEVQFQDVVQEYPFIKLNEKIDSEVIQIYCMPGTRGCGGIYRSVVFANNLRRTIYAPRDISDTINLSQILVLGSRIKKNSESDTLSVFLREDQVEPYNFILRKDK